MINICLTFIQRITVTSLRNYESCISRRVPTNAQRNVPSMPNALPIKAGVQVYYLPLSVCNLHGRDKLLKKTQRDAPVALQRFTSRGSDDR